MSLQKRYSRIVVIGLVLILAVGSLNFIAVPGSVKVTVLDRNTTTTVMTKAQTVSEFLDEQHIELGPYDEVSPGPNTRLLFDTTVSVFRPTAVTLSYGGETRNVLTGASTIGEFLEEQGITLNQSTRLEGFKTASLYDGKVITVTLISTQTQVSYEAIPFKTKKVENATMEKGETRVTRTGVNGTKTITDTVRYENGVEVSRVAKEEITTKPIDEVVEVGTKEYIVTASGTHLKNATRVLDYTATAYCLKGICASGCRSQVGVVAVDPRVIPLGTKLYIEAADGSWSYGFCIAGDTGGVIKGNIVDLYYDTYNECIQFGRRKATVYVLSE